MITDNVTGIFRRIFAAFWGPRTDDIFRAACLTLLRLRPARLRAGHPRRHPRRCSPTTPTAGASPPGSATRCCRVLGLVRAAVRRHPRARDRPADEQAPRVPAPHASPAQAIAAGPSTFDMTDVLDHGGLCLARLPKGILGEETAQLVGSFIVAATWQAAARRARLPEHRPARRGPVHRRVPELPQPALPAGRHPRRGPRLPAVDHHGPPEPRPAPRRPARRASPRTPAPRSSSPSAPKTPATSNATPSRA